MQLRKKRSNEISKNFRIVGRNDDLDVTWAFTEKVSVAHETALAVFPIITLWEFQKFKLNYLENVPIQFRENVAAAVTGNYLLLILIAYGSEWHFLNFRHCKSMAISADKFEV